MSHEKIATLLMAYGGPGSLDEIEPYLMDVRGGRPVAPELLQEIRKRYERIGGRSPLLDVTRAQAANLEKELKAQGVSSRVFVGMRHWHPYIREAVQEISSQNISKVVALCLAPQYSEMSVGAYFKQYQSAVAECNAHWKTIYVKCWHEHPNLLAAFASNAKEALLKFPESVRDEVVVIFTAHSLPEAILQRNDPYDVHVKTTAAGVARLMDIPCWIFAYQSQGYSKEKWLGPRVEDILQELAGTGTKNVLVAPVGFVSDHVEVMYDVDIAFRDLAASLGMRLERPESLNTHPLFIRSMADVIHSHLLETFQEME